MSAGDYASLTTEELLRRFVETAKRAGSVYGPDKSKLVGPMRKTLVAEMQALGAELRKRKPIDGLRRLFDDDDPDVRGWAGPQFYSLDPEWAGPMMSGLFHGLTTQQVFAWRQRIFRGAPKRPKLGEMTVSQLVDRFVDACERCYGATRFLTKEEGGWPTMKAYNKISFDFYGAAKELSRRGELGALLPLLNHPVITVRVWAARYCLPIATERAIATLEQGAAACGCVVERSDALQTLEYWKSGQYRAFPY
jgi:hypothetical protein